MCGQTCVGQRALSTTVTDMRQNWTAVTSVSHSADPEGGDLWDDLKGKFVTLSIDQNPLCQSRTLTNHARRGPRGTLFSGNSCQEHEIFRQSIFAIRQLSKLSGAPIFSLTPTALPSLTAF
jgi:hypothetical protein